MAGTEAGIWSGQDTPSLATLVGANVLRMSTNRTQPYFLERRVESVRFADARSATRTVEVHLRLNELADATKFPRLHGLLMVPIARLRRHDEDGKQLHAVLELHDERGAKVPRLTTDEERRLVYAGAWRNARSSLKRIPDAVTSETLRAIVYDNAPPQSLATLYTGDVVDGESVKADGQKLWEDREFVNLLTDAARFFYVVAPLDPARGVRRVLTLEYCENPTFDSGVGWKDIATRIALPRAGVRTTCDTPAAADCGSYHIQLFAPEDLEIAYSRLDIKEEGDPTRQTITGDRTQEGVAHAFWSGPGPIELGQFVAHLIPAVTGVTWAVRAVIAVIVALVGIGTAFAWLAPEHVLNNLDRSSLAALVLLAPGIVVTVLATRTKHRLTSRVLYGPRATVVLAALMLYLAGLASVAKPTEVTVLRVAWTIAAVGVAFCVWRVIAQELFVSRVKKGAS